VGFSGDDGEGFELRRALGSLGADTSHFLLRPDRMTFTYTKPLILRPGRPPEELSRIDIRSRTPTPPALEDEIISHLTAAAAAADAVIAMDQAPEPACGVLTRRVKAALADLARAHPQKIFIADSRTSIGEFAGVHVKVNAAELARHFSVAEKGADVAALAARWSQEIGRHVFVTLSAEGILAAAEGRVTRIPGIPAAPPIDVTGAGDAVLAHIAMALAAGATPAEAAALGNLAGAVVVKKIGTTGTATVEELIAKLQPGSC
jgi:bifunctional ADP-heptose synthase (sugar kinase/adenylyltransferase)